jgi:transketolase
MTTMIDSATVHDLAANAREMRREMVRMVERAGSGHFASALSCADIMCCFFSSRVMNLRPANMFAEDRDRFVLSAGHKALALYAALALRGFLNNKEDLQSFNKFNSRLGGHPDASKIPGVEISTGSLGHGLPIGVGMALASHYRKIAYRVYVLVGDGELAEGTNWEAALAASHYQLGNLTVIIDRNGLCADGTVADVMKIEPLGEKWAAFGWNVREIDGHDLTAIVDALESRASETGKPTIIMANTVKGKGSSFMENRYEWHNKVPSRYEFEQAYKELA